MQCSRSESFIKFTEDATPEDIRSAFSTYGRAKIILTLGAEGAMLATAHQQIKSPQPHLTALSFLCQGQVMRFSQAIFMLSSMLMMKKAPFNLAWMQQP